MKRIVLKKKSQGVWQKEIPKRELQEGNSKKELPIESLFSQMSELAGNRTIRFS